MEAPKTGLHKVWAINEHKDVLNAEWSSQDLRRKAIESWGGGERKERERKKERRIGLERLEGRDRNNYKLLYVKKLIETINYENEKYTERYRGEIEGDIEWERERERDDVTVFVAMEHQKKVCQKSLTSNDWHKKYFIVWNLSNVHRFSKHFASLSPSLSPSLLVSEEGKTGGVRGREREKELSKPRKS